MGFGELFERATQRHGVVWLGDADEVEVLERTVRKRAAVEGWRQLFPRAWLAPGSPLTPMATLTAATLATGGAASRWSALWLHGADVTLRPRPQVIVPYGRVGRRVGDVEVLRSRTLAEHHLTEVKGVPAVVAARAAVDLAPLLRGRALRNLLIDAVNAGIVDLGGLAALRAELRPGVPGLRAVDAALAELAETRSDSVFEHEVRTGLAAEGLPVHPEPFPFRCEDDEIVELDVAIPSHWVVVECDGRASHIGRRVFTTDRVRWTQIVRHWRPVWVSWDRWRDDRRGVIADVRRVMELADPSRLPARPEV